ncbi:MAG: hypothetical protein HYU33_05035, partial [Candidatus Omnitrophica bacterium]|nr:hypothetical protein [Candidatus Omnitrophota bacterium]
LFSRLQAVACLPQMGYRYPLFDSMFPHLEINWKALTVSELVVLLEIALTSCNRMFLRQIMTQAKKSSIDPGTYRYLTNHYYRMASGEPLLRLGSAARWLQSRVSR